MEIASFTWARNARRNKKGALEDRAKLSRRSGRREIGSKAHITHAGLGEDFDKARNWELQLNAQAKKQKPEAVEQQTG